jgi:redox-sensitive bicupin YhaK (pirin superfamily)
MIAVRKAESRGFADHGWLHSRHTFSFGSYYDPGHMGISNLRVINDDRVAPGGGFSTHGHRDMEIVTYVLSGALEHKDNLGNGSVIRPGDVQRMSAGTGVLHSEYNHSGDEPVHFLQIWLEPNRLDAEPGYAQKHFPAEQRRGRLQLLVSPDGRDGSISTNQDALLYGALLEAGEAVQQALALGRQAYLQVARGSVLLNGEALTAGDGAHVQDDRVIRIESTDSAEVLLFDLP